VALLILDPATEAAFRATRPGIDDERWTEVWDGVTVMSPLANISHQNLAAGLSGIFWYLFKVNGLAEVFQGVNISDRHPDWLENYRVPDVAVYLTGNPAVPHGTHYVGGPDLAVEVISPGENPTAKFTFYESINTQEVLLIQRYPWAVELYALVAGKLTPVPSGTSALGMTFSIVPAKPRPRVRVTTADREWLV
jgi:Uma2 family endonuclease